MTVETGRRLAWKDNNDKNHLEWAPPVRVIAVITLFASTLDLMADFLICARIAEFIHNFQSDLARIAAYGYFFFTGVSILVYIFEMTDVCLTLKNDEESVFWARLAKSLVLCCEEVPLPGLLYILFTNEPRLSLANPVFIGSWIKLIALTWGIVKFTKLRFFWPCLPLNPKHTSRENIRRCFTFTPYRIAMVVVNICHIFAIFIVINNLIASSKGGRPIAVSVSSSEAS
uniref:Uncharacterized protein n=1 Tax=Acrobeloides nanus TaxID=290746 RepID=A0A914C8H9_9BILA